MAIIEQFLAHVSTSFKAHLDVVPHSVQAVARRTGPWWSNTWTDVASQMRHATSTRPGAEPLYLDAYPAAPSLPPTPQQSFSNPQPRSRSMACSASSQSGATGGYRAPTGNEGSGGNGGPDANGNHPLPLIPCPLCGNRLSSLNSHFSQRNPSRH
jgi:hypothetical protein